MLESLLGVFSSSGIGALVGLVGSWVTKKEERRNLEMTLLHEKEMYQLKIAQQNDDNQYRLKIAEKELMTIEQQGQSAVNLQEATAFVTSQKSNMTLSSRFAELIRGLMRPVITLYLLSISTIIAFHIHTYMDGNIGVMQQQDLANMYQNTLDRIMFLTTTAVTWWFGSRPSNNRNINITR